MARLSAASAAAVALAVLLIAAAPSPASARRGVRGGSGATLGAPSLVGVWADAVSQSELELLLAKDRTGFLVDNGFGPASSPPATPQGLTLTFQSTGAFSASAPGAPPVKGQLRLYVCDQSSRGALLAVGTVEDAWAGAAVYRQLLAQLFRTRLATYLAIQEVAPDGQPVAAGDGIAGGDGRLLLKLSEEASAGSALTVAGSAARTLCGFSVV